MHQFLSASALAALALSDGRLYEAAAALGTTRWRVFLTVTLPGARYGVVSAAVVVFTLVVTDFGIPKVIGGQFAVLATDAYKQVVGQQNFSMGAVVGMVLLVPAVLAFFVEQILKRRQVALLSARAVPYTPRPEGRRDTALLLFCILKLFIYDLSYLETLPRIFSFIVLGLLLVGVSWLYTRFRERIERYL